jgi:hypothetical protein
MKQNGRDMDIAGIIKKAVNAGLLAGRLQAATLSGNTYKATEKRLYAYPVLLQKIADDKEKLMDLTKTGAPKRSKSVTRFSRSGVRLTPEEILDALAQDINATIAADQHEADIIAAALKTIENDSYYAVIVGKYLDGKSDDEIAALIPCDPSTVRRNRGRLIRRLAVWMYGAQAIQ